MKTVGGDVTLETVTTGLGLLLKHMLGGTPATVNPVGTAYEHTFTPGDLPIGLSVQVGRPDLAGVVQPFSYVGSRVASWQLAANVGEIGSLTPTFVSRDESTSESLGSASYAVDELLTFVEGSLTIAAAAVPVRAFELNGDNGLATDRGVLGSQLIEEPLEAGLRVYDGTIDAHFVDLTAYSRFVNGTEAALVFKFESTTEIETSYPFALEVTMNVRFDGETPQVGGPEEIPQNLAFKAIDDGSGPDSAISIKYTTTDATP